MFYFFPILLEILSQHMAGSSKAFLSSVGYSILRFGLKHSSISSSEKFVRRDALDNSTPRPSEYT